MREEVAFLYRVLEEKGVNDQAKQVSWRRIFQGDAGAKVKAKRMPGGGLMEQRKKVQLEPSEREVEKCVIKC